MLVMLEWGFYIKFCEIFWKNLERECSFSYLYLGRIKKILSSFRMHEAVFTKKFHFFLNYFALIPAFWNMFSAIWILLYEVVYVTVGNPAFFLFLYLTTVHFRGELQDTGDVSEKIIKCWPIKTREIGGVRL